MRKSQKRDTEKDKARRAYWISTERLKAAIAEGATPKRIERLQKTAEKQLNRYRLTISEQG